jgi:glycosyltransferase involved in cell wall biosynthesis
MREASSPRTVVVIPAFNEEESIEAVIRAVIAEGLPCVVVDDGSADRTAEVVSSTCASLVRLPINLGVGGALKVGFRFAVEHGYDQVVQIDADGQHPASQARLLMESASGSGADLVVGSRFAGPNTVYRISRVRRACIALLARRVRSVGVSVSDPTSGFRLIREPLLSQFARSFPAHYLGDTFEALLVAGRRGYNVVEVPIDMRDRQGGRPSADMKALIRSMIRSLAVGLTGPSFDVAPKGVTSGPP